MAFWQRKPPRDLTLEELEAQGLVDSVECHAVRALEILEFEDEGYTFFLELTDGRTLFLQGQYLYNYGLPDAGIAGEERGFPTTHFIIKRHRTKGHVVDMLVQGNFLEPELTLEPIDLEGLDFLTQECWDDGFGILPISFEEVQTQLKTMQSRD